METPEFEHDCDHCKFLGHYDRADLYFCGKSRPTLIARWSDDGPDYISGMSFVGKQSHLTEANKRAFNKGFIDITL